MTGRRVRASALALLLILALASGLADAADATRRAPRRLLQQRPSGSARPQRTTRAARAAAPTPAVSRDGVLAGEDARRAAPVARVTAPPSSATPSLGGARVAGNLDYEDVPADPKNEAVPERSDTDRDRVVVVPTPAPAPVVVSSGATAQPARQTRTSWDDDDDDDEEEEEDGDDDDEDGDDEDGEEDDEEGEEEDEKEGEAARDPGARPRPRTSPGDVGPSRNAPQTRARDAFPPRPPAPARKPPPAPRPPWPPWPAEPDAPWPPPAPRPPRPARAPTPTAAATTTTSSAATTPSGTPSGTPARPRRPEDAAGNATEVAGARELDSKQPDASEKAAAAYEAMLAYMKAKEEEEKKKTEKEKETETEATRGNETRPETSPETRPEDPAKDTAVNGTQPAAAEAHAAEGDETGVPNVGVAEVPGAVGASAAARGGGGGDTAGGDPGSELVVLESDGRSPPVGLALGGTQLAAGVAAFGCVGLIAAVWAARRATSGPHSSLERGWSSVKLPSGFRAKDNNAGGGEKDVRYRELQMTEEAATEGVGGSSSSSSSNEGRRGGRKKGGRRMTTEEESFYDL